VVEAVEAVPEPEYIGDVEVSHEEESAPEEVEASAVYEAPVAEVQVSETVEADETADETPVAEAQVPATDFAFTQSNFVNEDTAPPVVDSPNGEVEVQRFETTQSAPEPEPEPVYEIPVETVEAEKPRQRGRTVDLPIEVAEDERRSHSDARRFARLLVSEIRLYNEQKVIEGRESGDIYEILKEAIDRSREMYDKRVLPEVASKFDYFHYELVNNLAEGDEEKLGAGYLAVKA
jgi:hypothetical protein